MNSVTSDKRTPARGQSLASALQSSVPEMNGGFLVDESKAMMSITAEHGPTRVTYVREPDGTFTVVFEGSDGTRYWPPALSLWQQLTLRLRYSLHGRFTPIKRHRSK